MINQRTVLCTKTDADFDSRLASIVREQRGHLRWASTVAEWAEALDHHFPRLALLGLDQVVEPAPSDGTNGGINEEVDEAIPLPEPWTTTLRRVKILPHTKYIPVVAFCNDNADALSSALAEAKRLGAEETWQTTALRHQLPTLIQRYLDPPVRYLEGWDEALPALAREGLLTFNQQDYFEQHELLEGAWRAEERPIRDLYQGILQIGVAFYQIELGNWKGAIKTFRRGLPKLRDLPPSCQGVELAAFRTTAEQIHADLTQLGPDQMSQFDQRRFPQIKFDVEK